VARTHHGLRKISRERISSELAQILSSDSADGGIRLLADLNILGVILGLDADEPLELNPSVQLSSLDSTLPLRLAALIMSLDLDGDTADTVIESLKLPTAVSDECKLYLSAQDADIEISPVGARRLRKVFGDNTYNLIALAEELSLCGLDANTAAQLYHLVARSEIEDDCISLRQLALSGDDLISLGVPRGREVGDALNTLLEQVILRPELNTREQLADIVEKICNYSSKIE